MPFHSDSSFKLALFYFSPFPQSNLREEYSSLNVYNGFIKFYT